MIQQKKKICKSCQTDQFLFSKGRCKTCALREDSKPIKKQTTKNKVQKKAKRDLLTPFFQKHENIIKSKGLCCQECGGRLVGSFFECAHILDKQRYKSVMVVDDNVVYLCCGLNGESNCHSHFDNFGKNNLESLSKMSIFALVIEKYNKMKDKVIENGKLKQMLEDARNL